MTDGPARRGLPLIYDECRSRFRSTCEQAGLHWRAEPIAARGPLDQSLTIDHVRAGADRPRRALVVLSGVHGVEGFVNSALQCDLIARLDTASLGDDLAVFVVHAVNPWGMAHGRRQNESNVDLNRNWARSRRAPGRNDAYFEIHGLACPDTPSVPDVDSLLAAAGRLVAERGEEWVRNAITLGQYRHPDGLHYGGARTEESNRILERVVVEGLRGVESLFVVDLHTGHGPYGQLVTLSDRPCGSPQDVVLRSLFDTVETNAERQGRVSRVKAGAIARGIADDLDVDDAIVATIEVGTVDDVEQLAATYREQWVYRHGDVERPDHRAIRDRYRACFTPDDPEWAETALRRGRRHLDVALRYLVHG